MRWEACLGVLGVQRRGEAPQDPSVLSLPVPPTPPHLGFSSPATDSLAPPTVLGRLLPQALPWFLPLPGDPQASLPPPLQASAQSPGAQGGSPDLLVFFFFNLFIYFWLCWVFVPVRGLSLVVASGGHSSSRCAGLSLSRPLLLRSTGSRRTGSVVVAHGPTCSTACGIFPDQGSNPCPLHWQADSQPLRHQGSPDLLV